MIKNLTARFPELTKSDILISVETIIDAMSARLVSGGRIELRKFGTFSINMQNVSNISTTNVNDDPDYSMIHFKAGREIRRKLAKIDLEAND